MVAQRPEATSRRCGVGERQAPTSGMLVCVALSKSQLDKLGEQLRTVDAPSPPQIAVYDEYRASHDPALAEVQARVARASDLESSGRLKTLESTVAKLRRQRIRLSQIADIAGCRIVVPVARDQDAVLEDMASEFPDGQVKDYRIEPQHGYRAVHVLAQAANGLFVEIQIRTEAQDRWANLSEALAKQLDMGIKYGVGPEDVQRHLSSLSDALALLDQARSSVWHTQTELSRLKSEVEGDDPAASAKLAGIARLEERVRDLEEQATEMLHRIGEATGRISAGDST
jgi:putative GTP pyrophosphokinase